MVIDDDIEIIGHRGSQLSSRQPTPSTSTVAPQKRKAGPSNLKQETIELSDDGEVHVITGRERKVRGELQEQRTVLNTTCYLEA